MESNSLQRRQGLEEKVPELQRTIQMIAILQAKKVSTRRDRASPPTQELMWRSWALQEAGEPFDTTFELSDTLFARADIEQVDEVYIWLGVRRSSLPPSPKRGR